MNESKLLIDDNADILISTEKLNAYLKWRPLDTIIFRLAVDTINEPERYL